MTYEEIYQKLHATVCETLSRNIQTERIVESIANIIETFTENPYNDLLLHFYTQSKENYLSAHITNNVILAIGFGRCLALKAEDLMEIGQVALGHDIAMVEYLPLFTKERELTQDEMKLIRNHTTKSADLFRPHFSEKVVQAILDVHEQVDGRGYPSGKTGLEISSLAKIISICDVFEALTHVRNFRAQLNPYEAIKLIIRKKNVVFDGRVVNHFVDFLSIYPVGSLVALNTGEVGLVVGANPGSPTRCMVKVLMNADKEADPSGKVYDLLKSQMIYVVEVLSIRQEQEMMELLNPRGISFGKSLQTDG